MRKTKPAFISPRRYLTAPGRYSFSNEKEFKRFVEEIEAEKKIDERNKKIDKVLNGSNKTTT